MTTRRYVFHSDPGHGWLEVTAAELRDLRLPVSPYSFVSPDGLAVFLEEDCDAGAFVAAQAERLGYDADDPQVPARRECVTQHHKGDAPCRAMRHVGYDEFGRWISPYSKTKGA